MKNKETTKSEIISNEIQIPSIEKNKSSEELMVKKEKELENFQDLGEEIAGNSQDNNISNNLKDKWELILSKIELPSTRMLLSQQAELESFDSEKIIISLSPNWENMIKSRKVIIENTLKKIFGDQIMLNFTTKKLTSSNTTNSHKNTTNEPQTLKSIKKIEP